MAGKMLVMMDEDDLTRIFESCLRASRPTAGTAVSGSWNITPDGTVHSPFGPIPASGLEPAKTVPVKDAVEIDWITPALFLNTANWDPLLEEYGLTREEVSADIAAGDLHKQYRRPV